MENKDEILSNSTQVIQNQLADFLIEIVGNYFKMKDGYHLRRTRLYDIVLPRQVAMYLIRKKTTLSYKQIGKKFSNKDHATVLHSCKRVKDYMDVDKTLCKKIKEIEKIVKFKSKTEVGEHRIEESYYYVDLTNFFSFRLEDNKSIIFKGFSDAEIEKLKSNIKQQKECKKHVNTGLYILEKREQSNDTNNEERQGEAT
jgi:hypothetical protein